MFSVPIKEDSDCVVIVLHKILQVSRKGRNWVKRWVQSNPMIFLLQAGRVDKEKHRWILSLILYLSINSSHWPLAQTGLSEMGLFSNSVWICFTFLAKIKASSKTDRSKIISFINYIQWFYTVLDRTIQRAEWKLWIRWQLIFRFFFFFPPWKAVAKKNNQHSCFSW